MVKRITKNGRVHGFRPKPVTRRVVFDLDSVNAITSLVGRRERWEALVAGEGEEPLWAELRDGLTFAQQGRIPFTGTMLYAEVWEAIAPYVVAWNVLGEDEETGEERVLPAPAAAGMEIFAAAPKEIAIWLAWCLKFDKGDPDFPKERPPSVATDATADAASSA